MGKYKFYNRAEEENTAREIVDSMFTWADLDNRFMGVSSAYGNVDCPFHGTGYQRSKPAKFYMDEEKDIMVLHCFNEHRTFTCYDYVNLILVEQDRLYLDVWDFLERELGEEKLTGLVKVVKENQKLTDDNLYEQKKDYIETLYNCCDDTLTFINSLYLEKELD